MSDKPGGDRGDEPGGESGGGGHGGGGHGGPEPHPVGQAGQSLDAGERHNIVAQSIANGSMAGSTTGAQAGIDLNSQPAYMSVEAARQAAAQAAGELPGYEPPSAPMGADYIAPGPPAHPPSDAPPYDSVSADQMAAASEEANPAGVGALDDAIPLRNMQPDAPIDDNSIGNQPAQQNAPEHNDAAAKDSILRSKVFWTVAILGIFAALVTTFAVGIFRYRWFNLIDAENPVAKDIVLSDLPTGKPVVVDIAAHVVAGDDAIDFTKLVLVNDAGDQTALDVPGDGQWRVDATAGAVTFTPQTTPQPTANPAPVRYRVVDSAGRKSNVALIRLAFTGLMDADPGPMPQDDMEGPLAGDIRLTGQAAGTVLTFDVPSNVTKGVNDVDFTTVVLLDAPADRKKLVIKDKGTWTVDATSGVITFAPATGLKENPRPVRYQVSDVAGRISNPGTCQAGYASVAMPNVPVPPRATEAVDKHYFVDPSGPKPHIAPITFNMERWVTRGSKDIDWSTLRVSARAPVMGTKPAGVTTLDVPQEGRWTVDTASSSITFTPNSKSGNLFTGSPSPIVYWVEDVDGNRSAPALIIANKHIGEIAEAIRVMAGKDDATFWADYKRELVETHLSLEVVYGLTYQLEVATDAMISSRGRIQVRGQQKTPSDLGLRLRGKPYTDALDAWTDGSSAQLLSVAEAAVKTHLAGEAGLQPLVERDVQLLLILRLLRDEFITLKMMRRAGAGG